MRSYNLLKNTWRRVFSVRIIVTPRYFHHRTNENIIQHQEKLHYPREDVFTFMEKKMKAFENKVALTDCSSGQSFTYSNLLHQSKQLASYLDEQGYKEGDVAAVHVPNSIEYVVVLLGTMAKGMTLTTANPIYTSHEMHYQLNSSKPKILFTNAKLLNTAKKAIENTSIKQLISIDDVSSSDSQVVRLSDILARDDKTFSKQLDINPVEDTAFMLFSSGTTGLPKGVMLTHHNVLCNLIQLLVSLEPTCDNTNNSILCILPFFHIYGLMYLLLTHLAVGRTIYSLPAFDPVEFLTSIQKYQLHKTPVVPPIVLFLLNHPLVQQFDLSSLRYLTVGAAPLEETVTEAFNKKFPHITLLQGYGMTESMITHLQSDGDVLKPGSAGKSVPGVEWKIACLETGKALPPLEKGEVCTRGPQVMKGYLNNVKATSECLSNDGWLRSGDIGYYDDDHNIFVIDRLKELIKCKGLQVAPAELEGILLGHSEIAESCVIGIPSDRYGEVPRAYVVRTPNSSITEEEVKKFLSEKTSDHKHLRGGVQFINSIPKSLSGKILRRVLKEEYKANIQKVA